MRRIASTLAVVGLALSLSTTAKADLIGSLVTGQMLINSNPPNYFDPVNGFVPNGPLNKTQGITVAISGSATEFGYADTANGITADFGSTTLVLTNVSTGGAVAIKYIFTDNAFIGYSLSKQNDTFLNGGLNASLVGNTLTIDAPNFLGSSGTFNGTFLFTTTAAVPEPSQYAMAGLGGLFAVVAAARRRFARAA